MKMRNIVREKIAEKGYALGAFVASGSDTNCEILGLCGLDFVMIDCEHAQTDMESIVRMARASEMYGMAPLVRVYDMNDGPMAGRLLDVGIHGCMAPLVGTPEQAENMVKYMKYPPLGKRGANAGRGPRWGAYEDYSNVCNDNVLTIVQCESLEGLENIEKIAAVPGIDCIFIGTGDLSLEMGMQFTADTSSAHKVADTRMVDAIARILKACQDNNVIPGIVTLNAEDAAMRIKQGFQFVTCMNDLGLFKAAATNRIKSVHDLVNQK